MPGDPGELLLLTTSTSALPSRPHFRLPSSLAAPCRSHPEIPLGAAWAATSIFNRVRDYARAGQVVSNDSAHRRGLSSSEPSSSLAEAVPCVAIEYRIVAGASQALAAVQSSVADGASGKTGL